MQSRAFLRTYPASLAACGARALSRACAPRLQLCQVARPPLQLAPTTAVAEDVYTHGDAHVVSYDDMDPKELRQALQGLSLFIQDLQLDYVRLTEFADSQVAELTAYHQQVQQAQARTSALHADYLALQGAYEAQATATQKELHEAQMAAAGVPMLQQQVAMLQQRLVDQQQLADAAEAEARMLRTQLRAMKAEQQAAFASAASDPVAAAPPAPVPVASTLPKHWESGFTAVEQSMVMGRLSLAAEAVTERLLQLRSLNLLPPAVEQGVSELLQQAADSAGGWWQGSADRQAVQQWVLQQALAAARATPLQTITEGVASLMRAVGPEGSERVQTSPVLTELTAQLHKPWFLAACRLSEGTGSGGGRDRVGQQVQALVKQTAYALGRQQLGLRWMHGMTVNTEPQLQQLMLVAVQAVWLERSLPGVSVAVGPLGAQWQEGAWDTPLTALPGPAGQQHRCVLFCVRPGLSHTCPTSGAVTVLVRQQGVALEPCPVTAPVPVPATEINSNISTISDASPPAAGAMTEGKGTPVPAPEGYDSTPGIPAMA